VDALRARVLRIRPNANVSYVQGDCDDKATDIVANIPSDSLSLCFVDPYGISINFETLRTLSAKRVDFLVLLAVFMDAANAIPFPQFLAREFAASMELLGYLPTPLHKMKYTK